MDIVVLLVLVFYGCVGLGLAIMPIAVASTRRTIRRVASQAGMNSGYAHVVWLIGTCLAWPIGLFVLSTGRLLCVGPAPGRLVYSETLSVEKTAAPLRSCKKRAR